MVFQIRQSPVLNNFTLLIYGITFLAVIVFIGSLWLMSLLSLLTILLLLAEMRRYNSSVDGDPMTLTLRDKTGGIEIIERHGNEQYGQFQLFINRWFLILQLNNANNHKNLLLLPDRFRSMNEYLQFRYQIINMNRN
jgi:hypothetical protein